MQMQCFHNCTRGGLAHVLKLGAIEPHKYNYVFLAYGRPYFLRAKPIVGPDRLLTKDDIDKYLAVYMFSFPSKNIAIQVGAICDTGLYERGIFDSDNVLKDAPPLTELFLHAPFSESTAQYISEFWGDESAYVRSLYPTRQRPGWGKALKHLFKLLHSLNAKGSRWNLVRAAAETVEFQAERIRLDPGATLFCPALKAARVECEVNGAVRVRKYLNPPGTTLWQLLVQLRTAAIAAELEELHRA